MRFFLSVVFVLTFVPFGCAIKPIPVEKLNTIKRIGVVSILEDKLKMQYGGIIVFDKFTEEVPVEGWNIDKFITNEFKKYFIKIGMNFIELENEKKTFLKFQNNWFGIEDIKDELSRVTQINSLDALILVRRESFEDPVIYSHDVNGYGIFRGGNFGSALYFVVRVDMFDTKLMESLGSLLIYDSEEIDNSYFTKDISKLSKAQKDFIESWFKNTIQIGVKNVLDTLGIIIVDE
jgi:hypothetical protein